MTKQTLEREFDFLAKRDWVAGFHRFDAKGFGSMLRTKSESFWNDLGARRALALFHAAADRVPAYRNFLKMNGVRHQTVKNIGDFAKVPITTKENYVSRYPLASRIWDGDLARAKLIAASSGTSGEPKYWPREGFQEFEASVIHEMMYREFFAADKKRTLFLIGFPMGVYVSGVATLLPTWLAAQKFPGATVLSIGNNKTEMVRALKNLPHAYGQVVLIGHPFFIKDVIESGKREGISWRKMPVRLMFCSEGVSEEWRDYIAGEIGDRNSDRASIISTYGSSEFLLMGWETPLSIAFRRSFSDKGNAPNVFQYNPLHRFIESENGELIFTSASGIPLIRYNLKDAGEVLSKRSVMDQLKGRAPKPGTWNLPFVTLRGRNDQTIVFYAANIYPEHVRAGLNRTAFFKKLTGKFTMRKDYSRNMDEFLEVNIELREHVRPSRALETGIRNSIVEKLEKTNMEYKFLRGNLDKDIVPRIKLWTYGHEKYFKPGLKPRYIAKI